MKFSPFIDDFAPGLCSWIFLFLFFLWVSKIILSYWPRNRSGFFIFYFGAKNGVDRLMAKQQS